MSASEDAKHLCSWQVWRLKIIKVLVKRKVRTHKAGISIKPLLAQCANAAIKDKSYPYFYHRYQAIKKRRGHKRAIIDIAILYLQSQKFAVTKLMQGNGSP